MHEKGMTKMNLPPAFQFYPNDWLSSPKISTMTPAEEGAYIRLLCYAWSNPDCSLPDDDETLGQLSRLGERWLKGGSTRLRQCFTPHPRKPGRLFNARLLKERKKQEAWRCVEDLQRGSISMKCCVRCGSHNDCRDKRRKNSRAGATNSNAAKGTTQR